MIPAGPAPFDPAAITAAVTTLLAQTPMDGPHGFVTVVDLTGAHVALASKIGDGWTIDLRGGYDWQGPTPGADVAFTIGKRW